MTIEKSYTEPALTLMRKVLKGNGVRPDDVTIQKFDGAILEFTAMTQAVFSRNITEKTAPGKAASEKVYQNYQMARQNADSYISEVLQDPASIEQVKTIISQKPHHGFGLNGETIDLPFLDRDFVSHETCQPCRGNGRAPCIKCRGKGYEPCMHCHTQGFEKCHQCHGNRQIRGPQGQMQNCHLCQGRGQIVCSFCKSNRQIQCTTCQTKGDVQCQTCSGQGAQSTIISAKIVSQCSFDFDSEAVPSQARAVIQKLGSNLADQAQITAVSEKSEYHQKDGVLHLLYQVSVPQGQVEFMIKDKMVEAYLFGTKASIETIPDFLDKMITPGFDKLEHAVNQRGNISENIRGAMRYKTVKQAMILVTRYNPKKATKAILHYTPLGLSQQMAESLINNSNMALNNLTKRKRLMALIFGAGSAIALAAGYFFSPLRLIILEQVVNSSLHVAVDIFIAGLCGVIGYCVWQVMSSRARKQALASLSS